MPSKPTRRNSKPAPGVNDIVHIVFWDHAEDGGGHREALQFEVFGRIIRESKVSYQVECWAYVDPIEKLMGNPDNEHTFTIVKKAITGIRVLK